METKHYWLFNIIAPVYGLFYQKQKKMFSEVIQDVNHELDLTIYDTILDVGCGTGALCSVLKENGLSVTGIDPAEKMLKIARNKSGNAGIQFMKADALEKLPFKNGDFDVVIASYVAHGLQPDERKRMYAEMSRVADKLVIIYDYNEQRSVLTSIVEWLEGGDYFRFIRKAVPEMEDCENEMQSCFSEVRVLQVGERAAWYICKPIKVRE